MHLFDAETGERLPDYDGDREVVAAGAEAV